MVPESNSEPLPPLYARWLADLLGGAIPRESQANCSNCVMCSSGTAQPSDRTYFFNPEIKCCTYIPDLPNFLVGRILSDEDPAAQFGRSTVEKRIAEGIGVTPLGLAQPPVFSLLYNNSSQFFGQARNLRCPHYSTEDGGGCGIWRNRYSTCATWFCKHVRGQVGYAFWRDCLHPLLQQLEHALTRWCVLELPFKEETLRQLVASSHWRHEAEAVTGKAIDGKSDAKAHAQIWGEWRSHERELFVRCAELVNALSWSDVLAIGGPEVRAYARLTQSAYSKLLSDQVPRHLTVGPMQLVQIQNGLSRISTYSDFDAVDLPQSVMELLPYFDGRPTDQVLTAIANERGVTLESALVRKMVDFKLLVEPEKPLAKTVGADSRH